ncbi:hypothetical protein CC80DRAFT_567200 [Byssothecium circinans]|uniref:Uncharacterized protein n=1 Tax=Byssothecium circinans TaxID=147558 RepID=A0A6A5TPP4_9PLEO|nr:hypothetical protein CC80DRAFT_567200 [Byssothecium circinans]
MALSIRIKKKTSSPAIAGEPSFVTTMPAELRNEVYKLLFLDDEPLVVMEPQDHRNFGIDATPPATKFLSPSIGLLRTCRQVYHEAIGVLYSGNSFHVTAPPYSHNIYASQIWYTVNWLEGIGRNLKLVRNVDVDIDPICSAECIEAEEEVSQDGEEENEGKDRQLDILPIVKFLWNKSTSRRFKLSFINGGGKVHTNYFIDDDDDFRPTDAKLMNNVLRSLVVSDTLNIKQYGKHERIIYGIFIDKSQGHGEVVYSSSRFSEKTSFPHPFSIKKQGKSLAWIDLWEQETDYQRLPKHIRKKIVRYAIKNADPITMDIDRNTASGLDLNLLRINSSLRERTKLRFADWNQLTLRMTTTERVTSFGNFHHLRQWCRSSLSRMVPDVFEESQWDRTHYVEFVLRFELNYMSTLHDLRINILDFIQVTSMFDSEMRVVFLLKCHSNGPVYEQKCTMELQKLQDACRNFFQLLGKKDLYSGVRDCAALWFDGNGLPLLAVWKT